MPDIIINGMDMPIKNGCTILTIWPDGTVNAAVYTQGGRSATFSTKTAVQLPEGHGRIVDAAEVIEKANNSAWFDGDVSELGLLLGSEVTTIVPAEGGGEDG